MAEENEQASSRAGFFQLSLNELNRIATCDGGHHEVVAYIVLCSGVNIRNDLRCTTHGAKSIEQRSGISYRSAERAIEWLLQNGFIRKPDANAPSHLTKTPSRSAAVRWIIENQDPDVAIANQFLQLNATKSPLKTLIAETKGSIDCDIGRSQAITDSILVYAALMKNQDFADCAGVDPDVWHHKFFPIEGSECDDQSEHLVNVEGSNGILVTVKEADNQWTTLEFMRATLGGTDDVLLRARFWHAISNLRTLKLAYRVFVLWTGDPLNKSTRRKIEPMATLYINDRWARQLDPHLQYDVNLAAWRTGARDPYADFADADQGIPFIGSGCYRYIVRRGQESKVILLAQLRVRYWPANESTVAGRNVEKNRTEQWKNAINALGRK